jgi:hypothetical protein
MTPTPKPASGGAARQTAVEPGKPLEAAGPFVLNLTSSTTPMALANPEQPELKRFSFFVSRRFEEGRERFRLHMGYFSTLKEAEEWLVAVRDIYPGAWAGEAPGKKLRERAAAAAAAQATHAAGPPPMATPKPSAAPPRNVPTLPVAQATASVDVPALNVPTVHAPTLNPARPAAQVPKNVPVAKPAPVAPQPAMLHSPAKPVAPSVVGVPRPTKPAPVVPVAVPRSVAPAQGRPAAPLASVPTAPAAAARPPMAAVARAATPTARPAQPVKTAAPVASKPAPQAVARSAPPVAAARPNGKAKSAYPNSNVREVLKALDETSNDTEITGETRMMPAPSLSALDDGQDDSGFTDTQVLKYLETRRADGSEITGVDIETGAISLLKPDDTGTRRALKDAVSENAPVWFAVQLQWSVQPVELGKVPPLAIFSAYTLYTVEGSRDGRKWYGLRLGFFSDAISAKQVAYYVRSEFTSVAVVPVSPQERTRASDVEKKADMPFPKKSRQEPVDEFKLIDSDDRPAAPAARQRPAAATKPAAPAKSAPPAARRPEAKASNGRVRARDARSPQTLEETLEILGAGELEMDNGSGESMNESGVRHLRVEVQKNTPFGRLLERLSERVRKP